MYKLFPQAARHSLTRVAVQSFPRQSVAACVARRHFTSSKLQESSDSRSGGSPTPTIPSGRDPAWLSKLQKRVKQVRDQASGSTNLQQLEALDNRLSDSWLELSAGREGFLTESRWRGLDKHPIQWGDAVSSMGWCSDSSIWLTKRGTWQDSMVCFTTHEITSSDFCWSNNLVGWVCIHIKLLFRSYSYSPTYRACKQRNLQQIRRICPRKLGSRFCEHSPAWRAAGMARYHEPQRHWFDSKEY